MMRRFGFHLITSLIIVPLGTTALGDEPAGPGAQPESSKQKTEKKLLEGIKAPSDFKVTLFAAPPDIRYPACLAAAPTGEVFVGIDENGSLDAKADRGRVVRCIDDDGDGRADRFNVFAKMDSPRGLIVDGGTLYVLHPPKLTAFHDEDGDGVADRSEVLVDGIGFDLKFRGADHTTNGIRLGIDGWIYVAVGDYGFIKAVGKDGTALQLHGGGVARVRTDGTGLEQFSRGQRNIYDVAIDPLMNVFTRDNTNDGGGWDVRLSQVIQTGQYGYPSLFTRFSDEIVPPLADYGGGSPTGSLYVQEPGLPPGFSDTLYTCEWGRSVVERHPLESKGAGFKAGKEPFVELPRPTDMDIDGQSHIYIASWREGGFVFDKPDVGYVVRVSPKDHSPPKFPDLKAASDEQVVRYLAAPSDVLRLNAQREIVRRAKPSFAPELEALALADGPLPSRAAAIFALKQLLGNQAQASLIRLAKVDPVREFALRALADRKSDAAGSPAEPFLNALADTNPRVRLQAVIGLARLNHREAAQAILPCIEDDDPLVVHAAINALVSLDAVEVCLKALDPSSPRLIPGAVRVLQSLHDARTVDGLIQKLAKDRDETTQRACLKALCRLYYREADWDGRWWGTRPDTSGPYFTATAWSETDRIGRALTETLRKADTGLARWLLIELLKNKVDLDGSTAMAIKLAKDDPTLHIATVESLVGQQNLSDDAIRVLGTVAAAGRETPALRTKALRGLVRHLDQPAALDAAVTGFATVAGLEPRDSALNGVLQDFLREGRHARNLKPILAFVDDADPARSALAYAILLEVDRNPRSPSEAKAAVRKAIDGAWSQPKTAASLLRAIGQRRVTAYALQVRNHLEDPNQDVRDAAVIASRRLDLDHATRRGGKSAPTIATLPFDQVIAGLEKAKGDPSLGAELFQKQGCLACHTVAADEPPKGPFLGGIGTRYSRAELTESILKPNAKIAQGFETQKFATVAGLQYEGFVVREAGDEVELRNAAGEVTVIPKKDIEERGKAETSVMPTGLADPLTVADLASLLAYLESLKAK
ncbi:HEAT repeat domain-containing protein [Singulisphaera sp. Ch08]|uniref:HEAT repeat domain-containing protein n=1 Tax=Singulisphaera sp. Ch08 TaxID=3120278 RepID=A0AAU7CHF2_9BACT